MDEKITGGSSRALQCIPIAPSGFTKRKRQRFLDALAATCNVRMAAEAAGVDKSTAYRLRERDQSFADAWQTALGIGYFRLEDALLGYAVSRIEANEVDPDNADSNVIERSAAHRLSGGVVSVDELRFFLALLNRHRETEGRKRTGRRAPRATPEETDAALRKHLDVLARQIAKNGA
jgi:hypothetical protein